MVDHLIYILNLLSLSIAYAFLSSAPNKNPVKMDLNMKFVFSKGSGSLKDMGGIGNQGEYYYIPSKRPSLKAPMEALGREVSIPIFPRNQVLGPLGEEYLGVYEMRYRQLISDVGENGIFGHIYYSQENSKLALVGTLAKVVQMERLEDGGIYVIMQGVGRFYLRDIKSEKPYLKARVQIFNDYCESEDLIKILEQNLLSDIRYSVKLMKLLYPQNTYLINEAVLRNRPLIPTDDVRSVMLPGKDTNLVRRSKFSFANMDMLKTDPVTKLLFLQEPVVEKRYAGMLKVLEESVRFLEGELRRRGVITDEGMKRLKLDALSDISDLDLTPKTSWVPQNFVDGDWKMQPTLLD
eukprot:gene6003-8267_t